MTYFDAQNILDQRRAGQDMPEEVVTRALQMTGDVEHHYTVADAMREIAEAV